MSTDLEDLTILNMVEGLGAVRLRALLQYFKTTERILKATQNELERVPNIGPELARRIHSWRNLDLKGELALIEKEKVTLLPISNEHYPTNLKEIYDPPILLYVKGELTEEDKNAISIVGTRRPTYYGRSTAERLGYELGIRGITVVSGMARGIDTFSHRGALKAKARTLAILGSGLSNIYPRENRKLSHQIGECGAVISEFPMRMSPHRENFPRRNRLISGLSLGVVVVEAAQHSGSLITANFALNQGREVFAVPGKAGSVNTQGTHHLLRQGARLVESADDILEELPTLVRSEKKEEVLQRMELNEIETDLFKLLGDEPLHIEELLERTGLAAEKALSTLGMLEMKGLIRQLPGKMFVRR